MDQSQDIEGRPVATADTDTRNPKRRKISNPPSEPRNNAHARRHTNRVEKTSRGKRPSPRPPRDLRGSTGQAKPDSGLSTPQGTSKREPKFSLPFAKSVLDKIWIRNKNQHRTQPWWKSLSMLRKAVSRLVTIEQEERSLRDRPLGYGGATAMDAKAVRARFEREAQLRGEKEIWIDWIRQVLIPKAYLGFSGLVSDTQFAHLGLVLVGLLADVVGSVGLPTPSERQEGVEQALRRTGTITATTGRRDPSGTLETATSEAMARSLTAKSIRVTGLQSGEVVERTYDSDDLGEVVERKRSGPKQEQEQEQEQDREPSQAPTRPRSGRGADRNLAVLGKEDQDQALMVTGLADEDAPETNPSSTAERSRTAPSPSPTATAAAAASLATSFSPRDSVAIAAQTSQDDDDGGCGALPPPGPPPPPRRQHPHALPPGLAATGTTTTTTTTTSIVPNDKQVQTTPTATTTIAGAGDGAGKQVQARSKSNPEHNNSSSRSSITATTTTKGKDKGKGKGKRKGKNAIDDLFAGFT
ncbi:hypothetical protein AYL99_09189 [Fonsecaea erecta]|uniref:RNase MRP protein 1 RNA binding domain-containing protein n=1 Tax=Fonsecaea erecta TaxID=1367422 RepID=A0A178ZC74_9EURO|nr:hypothetical protein AYL99_09189 [Fonsecaea erecta]OAP57076.1 hypothetical protein AYL99_09189 [Fonsecaea erecta]